MKRLFTLALLFVALAAPSALADGLVTNAPPVPDHWRISAATFTPAASTDIYVEYLTSDGKVDHTEQIRVTAQAKRDGLFVATQTASGSDEAGLTRADGSPDFDAIFILRISRWLIADHELSGVTAVPTPTAAPAQ